MMDLDERFSGLLARYLEGNISLTDHDELFELLSSGKYDHLMEAELIADSTNIDESSSLCIPENESHNLVRNILAIAKEDELKSSKRSTLISLSKKWLVAASLLLVIASEFYFYNRGVFSQSFVGEFKVSSSNKVINQTDRLLKVSLPDGSEIILKPKASLFFSKKSFDSKREVYMEGEANFKIAKNPEKPFYVYYDKVVTKVLGTSFNIKTNLNSGNIEVEVLTGKVQVYENNKIVRNEQNDTKLIVTQNQKAVYDAQKRYFKAALVEHPLPIEPDAENILPEKVRSLKYMFEVPTKLSGVLHRIELDYGVDIIVNNDELYNYEFVGDISMEDLYDKLEIICLVTKTHYEVNGTKILLKSSNQ